MLTGQEIGSIIAQMRKLVHCPKLATYINLCELSDHVGLKNANVSGPQYNQGQNHCLGDCFMVSYSPPKSLKGTP